MATPSAGTATSGVSTANTTSQAVPNPAWNGTSSASGVLLVMFATSVASSTTFTSSGFTAVTAGSGQNCSGQLLYRVTDGSEGSSFTVTVSVTHIVNIVCVPVTGQSATNSGFDPLPAGSGTYLSATGNTITSPSATTTQNGDLLIWFGVSRVASGTAASVTVPTGFTQLSGFTPSGSGAGGASGLVNIGVATQATAGPTGSQAGSVSGATTDGGAVLVAVAGGASSVPGAATLSGAGSVSASAWQGTAGTTLSGAGSVSASQSFPPGAALTAQGSLTALPGLALRSAATVTTGTGSSTLAVPAQQCAAGDLVFIWAVSGFASVTFTSAGGDSLTAETANSPASPAMSTQLFRKIADSSDVAKAAAGGSYVITQSAAHVFNATIGVVPVTSAAHPFDPSDTPGSGVTTAAGTTVPASGVTTAVSGDLLVWLGADRNTLGAAPPAITVPGGYVVPAGVSQANSSGAGTNNVGTILATSAQGSAGATGSPAGSIGSSQITAGLLLAIKAAPVVPLAGIVLQMAAGAPTSSSVGVVVKTQGATSCRLAYSTSSGMSSPSYAAAQTPDSSGYVRYAVTGLTPATRYYFQVADTPAGGTETLIGIIGACKTTPAAGAPRNFTAAFVSCIAEQDVTSPAQDTAIQDWIAYDADVNIFTGDFDYSGTTSTTLSDQVGIFEGQISNIPGLAAMVSTRWGYYCRSDHEAGPDNGDSNNAYTATNIAATQQVFPSGVLGDTVNSPVHGLYQAWVIGRVRFIMIDIRNTDRSPGSNTDNSSKTMLGATQLAWLENQLIQPEPLKVIISDVAWMGTATTTNGPDKWWSYDTERQAILSYIAANAHLVQNLMLWHGDTHLVGYATGAANTWGGFPVWCAAPLLNIGGGLNTGTFTSFYNNAGGECRLYGRVSFTDSGSSITAAFQGWDAASGVAQVSRTETFPTPVADLAGTGSLAASGGPAGITALAGTGSLATAPAQGSGTALGGAGSLNAPAITQRPPATLAGTGSLAAAAAVRAGAALPGTGSVAALPGQQAGTSLGAAGSLATAPAQGSGTTLSGSGSVAALSGQQAGTSLAGTGSVTAQPGGGGTGSAALTGTGSLPATSVQRAGAALVGTGSLTGSATQATTGTTLAGTGSLTASPAARAAAVLPGTGSLATTAAQGSGAVLPGTGSLATAAAQGSGAVLSAAGALATAAAQGSGAVLSAAGALASAPGTSATGAATLSAAGALSATARLAAGGSLAGTGTLNASGGGGTLATATLAGTGSLTTGPAQLSFIVLAGTGALAAPVSSQLAGTALAGTGSLAQAVTQQAITALAGTGSLAGSGAIPGSVTLTGAGTLNQPGSLSGPPAALSGTGTITSVPVLRTAAALAGTGTLAAPGSLLSAAVLAGAGSLLALGSAHPPQVKGGSIAWSVTQPFLSVPAVGKQAGATATVTAPAGSSASVS